MIHKRDEAAVDAWDAEDHPASVKTGRTNDEVKSDRDATGSAVHRQLRREIDLSAAEPRPGPPGFIEPMLATLSDRPFDDADWLFEIKWDGYRVEAVLADGKVRIFTRNGHDATHLLPAPAPTADPLARARRTRSSMARSSRSTRPAGRTSRCSRRGSAVDRRPRPGSTARSDAGGWLGRAAADAEPRPRRSSTRSSTCSTSMDGRCSGSRSRSASGSCGRRQRRLGRPLRRPCRGGGQGLLPRGRGPGPRGGHRQASSLALRAGHAGHPPGSSSSSGPSRSSSSAAGRRARAMPGSSGRSSSASWTTAGCASRGRSGRASTPGARRQLRERLDALAADDPPFDPPPGQRPRTCAASLDRAAPRHPRRARRLDVGTGSSASRRTRASTMAATRSRSTRESPVVELRGGDAGGAGRSSRRWSWHGRRTTSSSKAAARPTGAGPPRRRPSSTRSRGWVRAAAGRSAGSSSS